MTIVFGQSILSTKLNEAEAVALLAQMKHARDKWIAEGKPKSKA